MPEEIKNPRRCLVCKMSLKTGDQYKLFCSAKCDEKYEKRYSRFSRNCICCGKSLRHKQVKCGHRHCSAECVQKLRKTKDEYRESIKKTIDEKNREQINGLRKLVKECLKEIQ